MNQREPVTETDCVFCNDDTWGLDESQDPYNSMPAGDRTLLSATWIVAGYPLCLPHALRELRDIMEWPESFVHSWPAGQDRVAWGDAVPFYIQVRMIETPDQAQAFWRSPHEVAERR